MAKGVGDRVVAGTVSTDSSVRVPVDAGGDDTALAGIITKVAWLAAPGGRHGRRRRRPHLERPAPVLGVIRLSQASDRKMVQNLAWAAGDNLAAIPLAVLVSTSLR